MAIANDNIIFDSMFPKHIQLMSKFTIIQRTVNAIDKTTISLALSSFAQTNSIEYHFAVFGMETMNFRYSSSKYKLCVNPTLSAHTTQLHRHSIHILLNPQILGASTRNQYIAWFILKHNFFL